MASTGHVRRHTDLAAPASSGTRSKLFSKLNKLVRPASESSSTPAEATQAREGRAEPFQITHEPDRTPAYTPSRPVQPRSESECQEALQEMFAQARIHNRTPVPEPSEAPHSAPNRHLSQRSFSRVRRIEAPQELDGFGENRHV